jgi:branched-subunit amino acid aminotransferase/4-amino-4-deoxychorismate lyase
VSAPHVVYLDGQFRPEPEARIPVGDRGFLYGDAVFETIRTYRGVPHLLGEHLGRLRRGARVLGFAVPRPSGGWRRVVAELLGRNGRSHGDVAVRITVTRGTGGESLVPLRGAQPRILATIRELDPRILALREHGAAVVIVPFEPARAGPMAGVKTTAYAAAILAKQAAARSGALEGLYSSPRGLLSEGATSNLFLVRRGRLETPALERGGLPGITRARVLELALRSNLPVLERPLRRSDLLRAEEAFLTATTIEVLPIRSVDGVDLADAPGPITRQLQAMYCRSHGAADCQQREFPSTGVRISAALDENCRSR